MNISPRVLSGPHACRPPRSRTSFAARHLLGLTAAVLVIPVHAASLLQSWSGSVTIPDNDPSGAAFGFVLDGSALPIAGVTVSLDVAGGFNGDLYAYLAHGTGFAVLLNRVGLTADNESGSGDTGLAVTLTAQAAGDIHQYETLGAHRNATGQVIGTWSPDGRVLDPSSTGTAFDSALRLALLTSFIGLDPRGYWALFVADLSGGDRATLNAWSVEITPIPEPDLLAVAAALAALAGVIGFRLLPNNRLPPPSRQPGRSNR